MDTRLACVALASIAMVTAGAVRVPVSGQQPQAAQQSPAGQPGAASQAQQKPQRPVFRAGASLVRVDVTVTSRNGEPVADLQPEDFVLSEDGYPQEIQAFEFVRSTGEPTDDRSLEIRTPQHAAYEAGRDDVRVFLIFWDEYHIGEFIPALRGREILSYFVRNAFGPTDLVGIMDQLTTVDSIRFTRDRNALADRVRALKGRFGVFFPARSPIEEVQLRMTRDAGRLRNEISISALQSAAAYLGNLREGRKVLLFVSQGVAIYGRNNENELFRQLVETANQNNTAIYTLDPASEVGRRPGSLLSIADSTGGKAFVGTNAPGILLPQIVKDSSAYYLLGYVSNRDPADGKFHKINVRLKKSGFDVRGRTGYFAPSRDAVEKARAAAEAATLPPPMERALSDLRTGARQERAAAVWVGMARGSEGRTKVTLVWTPRPALTEPVRPATTTLAVNVAAPDAPPYFDERIEPARVVTFDATPGEMILKLTAFDAKGEEVDGEVRRVAVPSFAGDVLALGTPVVYRARSAIDVRRLQESADVRPEVGRVFEATDRLFIRVPLYGSGAPTAHLLNILGAVMREVPLAALPGGIYQLDMPLTVLPRGEYFIRIDAAGGDEAARQVVAFRIR